MNRIMRVLGIAAMVGLTATCVFAGGQAIAIDNTSNDPAIYGGTYGGSTARLEQPHGGLAWRLVDRHRQRADPSAIAGCQF